MIFFFGNYYTIFYSQISIDADETNIFILYYIGGGRRKVGLKKKNMLQLFFNEKYSM